MTPPYYYYEAMLGTGKKIHLFARDDIEQVEIEFNTAWSPPEAICSAIREQYPDVSVSWFYDEPGCEIAGYL